MRETIPSKAEALRPQTLATAILAVLSMEFSALARAWITHWRQGRVIRQTALEPSRKVQAERSPLTQSSIRDRLIQPPRLQQRSHFTALGETAGLTLLDALSMGRDTRHAQRQRIIRV